jgi:perosamine synthetase
MIPLAKPDINDNDIAEVVRVLKSGMLVQGKEVAQLEKDFADYIGVKYATAVSSGTATLHLALTAMGVQKHDEVIVPAFSYVATANVVELVGATPVFVDVEANSFNIDVSLIEQHISSKTKAIMPVHEFGLAANIPEILRIADKHNLKVIEDAACALGAGIDNKKVGSYGDVGSFSFHPRKAITSGEGGILTTSDKELDTLFKTLRNHGISLESSQMKFVAAGFNYRMTDFQAALVNSQFSRMDDIIAHRQETAKIYFNQIDNTDIIVPTHPENFRHTWQTYHIICKDEIMRDDLSDYLKQNGVQTNYGAQCIPATDYYKTKYNYESEMQFPNAYRAYTCGLALPVHTFVSEQDILYIANLINNYKL